MQNQIKQGFTLVELIVVITILAILATIGFLSLQGYSANARDGKRVSDIQLIGSSLELFQLNTGKYPEPTNSFEVTYSGSEVRKQGTFGETSFKNVEKLNKIPLDPSTNDEYTYSVLNTRNEYELGSIYESTNLLGRKGLLRETYAGTKNALAMIKGNYNGIFAKVFSGSTTYVLAVPSIINSEIGNVDIIDLIQNKKMVYKGYKNLPSGYKNSDYNINGEEDEDFNIVNSGSILLFSGSVDDFKSENAQLAFISNLQNAYSGTHIKGQADIDNILKQDVVGGKGGALLISQVLIHDHINKEVEIKALSIGSSNGNSNILDDDDNGIKISSGQNHTCAINIDGDLYCWGANGNGELGDGTTIQKITPVHIMSGVSDVSVGGTYSCAVLTGGDLKCWGNNFNGQVGTGSLSNILLPTYVLSGISKVSLGFWHTCALSTSGDLKCWGVNGYGQLGDGTTVNKSSPPATPILTGISKISCGYETTCAVTTSGDLKCWGRNSEGQVGTGTTAKTPQYVLSGISKVRVGRYHTCSISTMKDLKCWGLNSNGQLGDGTYVNKSRPPTTPILSGISKVSLGTNHTCALTTSGDLKCWGHSDAGQIGEMGYSLLPKTILNGISNLSLGNNYTCISTIGGVLKCFGSNAYGKLGSGSILGSYTNHVKILSGNPDIYSSYNSSCLITTSGDLYCWGDNTYGQLGDGTKFIKTIPTFILSGVSKVNIGSRHTCAITTSGDLKCWGDNTSGQLGDGTKISKLVPPELPILTGISNVSLRSSHTCAITTSGDLKCWGGNTYGQLGDGTTVEKTSPPELPILTGVTNVSLGDLHTCAVTSGNLKCWGSDDLGQLGNGLGSSNILLPPTTPILTGVASVSSGSRYSCAIMTSGDLKCWGKNDDEQILPGTMPYYNVPTPIMAGTQFSKVSLGNIHTCAIKTNGDLYCWGYNSKGQIGNGTTDSIFTNTAPTQIEPGTKFSKVSLGNFHTCVVTEEGDLKCCGENIIGQLGFNIYGIRDVNINP